MVARVYRDLDPVVEYGVEVGYVNLAALKAVEDVLAGWHWEDEECEEEKKKKRALE